MKFILLEAPSALGSASRNAPVQTTAPKSAFGSASRTIKPKDEKPKLYDTKQGSKEGTTNNPAGENYEDIFRDTYNDSATREVALVKWLEQYMSGSPLSRFLSSRIKVDSLDDVPTSPSGGSFEERTQQAAADAKFREVIKDTAQKRAEMQEVFSAIFFSIDNDSTLFEDVLLKLDIHRIPTSRYYNLVALANAVVKDSTIDTKQKYLLNTSLYDRETADFNYTLGILDRCHNSAKLSKYFNPKDVDIKELFDGNDIKPAGIIAKDPNDFSTIFGTVESWKNIADPKSALKNTGGATKSKSKYSTFKSFEAANKKGEDSIGNVVHIDGDFKFDGKEWKPVT